MSEKKEIRNARTIASYKYSEKAYDRLVMNVYKGKKEMIFKHAEAMGETVNQFLIRAVQETIIRDGGSIDLFEKTEVKNPPKNNNISEKLLDFCKEKKTRKEIQAFLGYKSVDHAMKYVTPLINDGSITVTEVKIRGFIQKYYQTTISENQE